MQKRITIDGYIVDLDTDVNGDGETTGCWIHRAGYSASLECADAVGYLSDNNDREHPVPASTLAKIRLWAEGNGY